MILQMVEVTLTLILHKIIFNSTVPTENVMEITDIFPYLDMILIYNLSIHCILYFMLLKELLDIRVSCSLNAGNLQCHEMAD